MDNNLPPLYTRLDRSDTHFNPGKVKGQSIPRKPLSIPRKAVSSSTLRATGLIESRKSDASQGQDGFGESYHDTGLSDGRLDSSIGKTSTACSSESQLYQVRTGVSLSTIKGGEESASLSPADSVVTEPLSSTSGNSNGRNPLSTTLSSSSLSSFASKTSSLSSKAYQETRHWAGGLIHHPSESNKHFSILRHSHGLVFYQGTATSLAVSIFADMPLPTNRSLWMQCKGYSGNTGMRLKTLVGRDGSWINVTPVIQITAKQLSPTDERAWQRDIKSFLKRSDKRVRETHILRETAIVRIPAEAEDGYFRLMLCLEDAKKPDKKRVLCGSPTFRVLSTSTSPGMIKGSSLSSLPFEIGAKIATSVARSTIGAAASPYTTAAQTAVARFQPPGWALTAYSMTAEDKVNAQVADVQGDFSQRRALHFAQIADAEGIIDEGPATPYPLVFTAKAVTPSLWGNNALSMPVINLVSVPEVMARRLEGHYFGWLRLDNKEITKSKDQSTDDEWTQVIVSAVPVDHTQLARVKVGHAGDKEFSVQILQEFLLPNSGKLQFELRVFGFLRHHKTYAASPSSAESMDKIADEQLIDSFNDVEIAQAWLDRPAWGADALSTRAAGEESKPGYLTKVKTGLVESRLTVQQQIDKVAFHRAGLRVNTDDLRSQAIGNGGLFVLR